MVIQIDNESASLTVSDFTNNLDEIYRYTIGPKDGQGYAGTYDLTRAELEALLDTIRERKH